jgi:DNA-binding transcriptional LysR family regulator
MQRGSLDDLLAFIAVGRERSFTKAAAKLGVSQSALSHTIRELEEQLGVRLLTRTTRSVSPTEAGERLLQRLGPHFEEIEAEVAGIRELRDKPAGTVRITATEYAANAILLPKLAKLIREYPDIKVEIMIDYGLADIVAQRFDAGVRSGEQVAKDMIAVRIGPDMRMAVVGAPSYFKGRPEPKNPHDLIVPPGAEAAMLSVVPIGRWCEPEEVADVVVFLCSDGASHVTGHIMPIDGGWTAR